MNTNALNRIGIALLVILLAPGACGRDRSLGAPGWLGRLFDGIGRPCRRRSRRHDRHRARHVPGVSRRHEANRLHRLVGGRGHDPGRGKDSSADAAQIGIVGELAHRAHPDARGGRVTARESSWRTAAPLPSGTAPSPMSKSEHVSTAPRSIVSGPSTLTIEDCAFNDNYSRHGAAVHITGGAFSTARSSGGASPSIPRYNWRGSHRRQ